MNAWPGLKYLLDGAWVDAPWLAVDDRGLVIATPREQLRPWFDVAAGLRAHAALLPGFGLELAGGLLVPITRETWIFERPDTVIHETPPVGAYVTAGVRVVLTP